MRRVASICFRTGPRHSRRCGSCETARPRSSGAEGVPPESREIRYRQWTETGLVSRPGSGAAPTCQGEDERSWTSIWTDWTEAKHNIMLARYSYIAIWLYKGMTRKSTSVIVDDSACYNLIYIYF